MDNKTDTDKKEKVIRLDGSTLGLATNFLDELKALEEKNQQLIDENEKLNEHMGVLRRTIGFLEDKVKYMTPPPNETVGKKSKKKGKGGCTTDIEEESPVVQPDIE